MDENLNEEDHNLEEDQQDMLNDEFDVVDMNNHDAEIGKDEVVDFESNNSPTPIVGSIIPCSSQSSRVNNVRDDETSFYKGMTFKNKEELANSLKIAFLKKDFRLKKVINSRKYFENRFPNGKDPSTRDMSNQLHTNWVVRYPSIRKMVSTIYLASHYGCCMRHLRENIRNNFHNSKVVTHFYKATRAYDKCEFNDHFNQIRDLVPKAAKTLERIGFHTWSRAFCPGNSSRVLNQVPNEPSVYQKVTLVNFPYCRWSIVQEAISFLEMCRASENSEALYRKGVFDFFNRNDPTSLGMTNAAANGGHISASYVLAIISIFNGGESIREVSGSSIKSLMNLLYIRRASGNLEALYRKGMYDFFNHSDSNGLGMISQAADGGHIGASYVLAIISIFNGGEFIREGVMFIANLTPLKLRRC
ncbi:hypothetical protein H5410_006296 [Solanum commersonii]|uniref:At2g35280-like TPR domain-containing protein n=1 Tax=Solanum commersonii TaxID=4109 RepID=A0A9J6A8S4_SOLCO|nr:hypothetical protein H5410_006296 [Solanum commersonii]